MDSNKQNKKNKKKMALNCAIGTLALLGCAGTITFGTLWCQTRNNGGGDIPVDDKIIKAQFSWTRQGEEPFVYPDDYQPLPEGQMKLGELWNAFTSDDKCGYYLACDYVSIISFFLADENDATVDANVELNVTKKRLTLDVKTINLSENDKWIRFTNVPVAIDWLISSTDPLKYSWHLGPIGSIYDPTISPLPSFDIFSIPDWKIEYKIEDEVEISPDSGMESVGVWSTDASNLTAQIHYFDKITIE